MRFMWLHAFHVACGVSDFMCFMWLHAFHVFGLWWQGVEFHGFHVVSCVSCGFMWFHVRLGVASRINCIIRAVHPIDDDGLGNFQKF